MPLFTYTARDKEGKLTRGSIDAFSAQAARDSLKEMDLQAEEIYEVPEHLRDPEPSAPSVVHVEKPMPKPAWTVQESPAPLPNASPSVAAHAISHGEIMADHLAIKEKALGQMETTVMYFPLMDTLRLYAGWLLSWYFLIFAFGSYAYLRELPFTIPLASGLFQSPVIISFAFGAFLFLLVTELHKVFRGGKFAGFLLTVVWFGVFGLFRMNV